MFRASALSEVEERRLQLRKCVSTTLGAPELGGFSRRCAVMLGVVSKHDVSNGMHPSEIHSFHIQVEQQVFQGLQQFGQVVRLIVRLGFLDAFQQRFQRLMILGFQVVAGQ